MIGKGVPPPPPLDGQGLPVGTAFRDHLEVTPRQARAMLEKPGADGPALLIDVRTPREWETARIPGARLIPLQELERRFDEIAEELEDHPRRPVIVHCHHGMRSLRATSFLQAKGVTQARSMAGGIDLWSIDIDPSVPRYA